MVFGTGDAMKLLLTSGGITNATIKNGLQRLLGKPVSESTVLVIPTAQWGHPYCGPNSVQSLISGAPTFQYFTGLGWKSLGVLELTALPTIGRDRWIPWIDEIDALLVDGGGATYLAYWMRESGLHELLDKWPDKVWVDVSVGSMVMTPRIGNAFVEWCGAEDDRGLGVVDFSIFPHLHALPNNSLDHARKWAREIGGPAYAIDEQTAIAVVDGVVECYPKVSGSAGNPNDELM